MVDLIIAGYLDSSHSVFFIRGILVLVTCFVVAYNSQFARPAPRHSSSTQGGCAVNGLLFKMATRSSVDSIVPVKTHSCAEEGDIYRPVHCARIFEQSSFVQATDLECVKCV